jgi:hypothetical protein
MIPQMSKYFKYFGENENLYTKGRLTLGNPKIKRLNKFT